MAVTFAVAIAVLWIVLRERPTPSSVAPSTSSTSEAAGGPATTHGRTALLAKRSAPPPPVVGKGEIHGLVYTLEGVPADKARITLQRGMSVGNYAGEDRPGPTRYETGADGKFAATQLTDGWYGVSASLGEASASTFVQLKPDERRAEVVLVLFSGKPLGGRVVNEDGEGVVGARLAPVIHDREDVNRHESGAMAIEAGASGEFVFPALEPRTWNLYVTAENYAPKLSDELIAGATDNTIVLTRGVALSGSVIDDATDGPLEGVWVSAKPADLTVPPVRAMSGGQGQFQLPPLDTKSFVIDIDTVPYVLKGGPLDLAIDSTGPPGPLELRVVEGGTIRGRVIEAATQEPVGGVILRATPESKSRRTLETTSSDEDGHFEFAGVQTDSYTITPRLMNGFAKTGSSSRAVRVAVAPGEVIDGVDITLSRDITITGTVIDRDGKPFHGAEVRGDGGNIGWQDQTKSAEDGTFTLAGIKGECDVAVAANTPALASENQDIHVPLEGVTGVIIKLDIDRSGSIAGTLVDPHGNPVRADIAAWGDTKLPNVPGFTNTASDGRFFIRSLIADRYQILASVGHGQPYPVRTITLGPGQAVRDLRLVFTAEGSSSISGKVLDASGGPVIASISSWRRVESGQGASRFPAGFAESRRDGAFEIAGLEEGVYELTASANEYVEQTVYVEAGARDVVIVMGGHTLLTGVVIDAKTQQPLTEFEVAVLDHSGAPETKDWRRVSNPEGRFEQPCAPGYYVATARATGYQPNRAKITIGDDQSNGSVVIALEPGDFSVEGRVIDRTGQPVSGATVFIGPLSKFPEHLAHKAVARSDAEGLFEITGLAMKPSLLFSAFHPAAGVGTVTTGFDGQNPRAKVEIVLEATGAIDGCVYENDRPVPNVRVEAKSESGSYYTATTGDDGCFRFSNIVPGLVTLTVEGFSQGVGPTTTQVEVPSNMTVTANLHIPAAK